MVAYMAESSVFIRVLALGSGITVVWVIFASVLRVFPFFLGGSFWAAGVASAFLVLLGQLGIVGNSSVPSDTLSESHIG
jgi:hypothetical protein